MRRIKRSPTYLFHNSHSYCFRMRVPDDLYAYIGRKELRFSLQTGYLGIARSMARTLAVKVQIIFRELRTKG